MSAESFLSSIVEVAVGIAGFAGIIAAIRQRNITHWPVEQRILLSMLLIASAMAVLFALLPALLVEAQVPRSTIWRIGSALLLVWQVGIFGHRTRQFRASALPAPVPRFVAAGAVFIVLLQALNLKLCTSWPYLLGVFGMLVSGFSFFMVLLLGTHEEVRRDISAHE